MHPWFYLDFGKERLVTTINIFSDFNIKLLVSFYTNYSRSKTPN